jgi:hypothetical protein
MRGERQLSCVSSQSFANPALLSSLSAYHSALEQANDILETPSSSTSARIRERSLKLERAALALLAASAIQRAQVTW